MRKDAYTSLRLVNTAKEVTEFMSAKGYPAPNRLPKGESLKNNVLGVYKRNAHNREIKWSLTDERFKALIILPCHYCGIVSSMVATAKCLFGDLAHNGVDRVNNKLGYTVENSVPCCKLCQKMKGTMSHEEFVNHSKRVADHLSR